VNTEHPGRFLGSTGSTGSHRTCSQRWIDFLFAFQPGTALQLLLASTTSGFYTVTNGELSCEAETTICGISGDGLTLSRISSDPNNRPYECLDERCFDNQSIGGADSSAVEAFKETWSCGTCFQQENKLCPNEDRCSSPVDIDPRGEISTSQARDIVGYSVSAGQVFAAEFCIGFCAPAEIVATLIDSVYECGKCPSSFNSGPCSLCGDDQE